MSAIADKCTIGIMCFKVTERDNDKLKHILERGIYEKPDYSHWVYKNRSGRNNLIIWTKLDYGTMHEKMCFITTSDYELVTDIQPVEMVFKNENNDLDNPFSN